MSLSLDQTKNILEAALLSAGQPLSVDRLLNLFLDEHQPSREEILLALNTLAGECANRGVELKEVSSGYRFQAKQDYAKWVSRLWEEKPARYSRALLETLALIAYRQPITRGEIEDIRGVTVGTNIMKSLLERDWVKVVGHRDVPGKPAMYATTREFLDYFNLKSLGELPTLAEIRDIDSINAELDLVDPGTPAPLAEEASEEMSENMSEEMSEAMAGEMSEETAEEMAEEMAEPAGEPAAADEALITPSESETAVDDEPPLQQTPVNADSGE